MDKKNKSIEEEEKPILEFNDLNLHYGRKQALKNVNFKIFRNKITAIIGPSGCGKSTALRCINRMNDLIGSVEVSGELTLNGKNIYEQDIDPVKLRKHIGMVFQQPNPFPKSIYENVAYGPKIHGEKNKERLDKIVEDSLKKAALWDEVKDRLDEGALSLSGGQQQRLCIARAIAIEPEIILFDEPCSALDPIATAKIEELLIGLKKDYTVLIVTHNMQQAARIGDFTAFFLMGELIEYDKTSKIFEFPEDKRTEDYITGRFG